MLLVQLEELYPALFAKDLAEIEQPELGQNHGGLQKRVALHPPEPADHPDTGCRIALDLVAREGLPAVLHGQDVFGHPHGDLPTGEPLLSVEPEALEGEVAQVVEGARVAG